MFSFSVKFQEIALSKNLFKKKNLRKNVVKIGMCNWFKTFVIYAIIFYNEKKKKSVISHNLLTLKIAMD